MSLQLQPDQLLVVLQRLDHPAFPSFLDQLLSLSDEMAAAIVESVPNLTAGACANFWDDMLCVPITPIDPKQPIPPALQGLDDGGWQ